MQRTQLNAVALAALVVASLVAGVGLGSQPAAAEHTDASQLEYIETHTLPAGEFLQQGFAEHEDELYIAGAYNNQIQVLDESLSEQRTYSLDHQPSGLTRFDGSWILSTESGTLERYDDSFTHVETVVSGGFADTTTAPWNIDSYNGQLYVADETDVAVFDETFTEIDRFTTDTSPIHPLHVVDGSVFVANNEDGIFYEYTVEGELLGTYEPNITWDFGPGGMGLYNGHWYVGTGFDNPEIHELGAEISTTATVSGTVTDQDGRPVANATVAAVGVLDDGLNVSDPEDLEREADDLLAELSDPLPASFDREYDLESHAEQAEGTYVLAHEARDWGVGTTHIADSSVDEPRVVLSSDRDVVLSLWDPTADGGFLENQVDQSSVGATTDGEIRVEQLAGSGDTLETSTYETEPYASTTGVNPLTERDHYAVETRLPVGIYRVAPESNPAGGYVLAVGSPSEIAASIAADARDEAGQLTERADRVRGLLEDGVLVRETARTDADGQFSLEVDGRAVSVQLEALRADGTVLEGVTDPSLEDLREARLSDYNGSVYLPAPDGQRVDVPAEGVEVDVYRSPSVPLGSIDSFADLQAHLEDAFLNSSVGETPFDTPLESIGDETLSEYEDQLEELADANDELADAVGGLEDTEDLRERVGELDRALENASRIAPGNGEGTIEDGELEVWQDFPESVEQAVVTVEYENGEVETVPDENVSIDSAGWLSGDRVSVEGYEIPADRAVADVSIRAAGSAGVGEGGQSVVNPAVAESIPAVESVRFSTLAPGVGEQVSLEVDSEAAVVGADVRGPDGQPVNASVGDGVTFATAGEGVHTVTVTLREQGHEYQLVERIVAFETSRSDPPTVRAGDSVVGAYGVVGEHLGGADVEAGRGDVDVTAVVRGDETPASVHVKPGPVLEGDETELEVSVERGDGSAVRSHLEVVSHFDSEYYSNESIVWRNGDPITKDGSTRFGDRQVRESSGKALLYTFSNERGSVTVDLRTDPDRLERLSHWMDYVVPTPTWPLAVGESASGARIVG